MRQVFGDAFCWIALTDPGDGWHARVRAVGQTLGPVRIVTTEPVLAEPLHHFTGPDGYWRGRALAIVDTIRQRAPRARAGSVHPPDLGERRCRLRKWVESISFSVVPYPRARLLALYAEPTGVRPSPALLPFRVDALLPT